jgi:hypothetical protein
MASESEGEEDFNTKSLQKLLESMYDELTDCAIASKKIYYAAKEPQDYFTHEFKLKPAARKLLGVKRISLEKLLARWTPIWKREGRLNFNGSLVRLGKEEADLLGFQPEETLDVYEVCAKAGGVFESR